MVGVVYAKRFVILRYDRPQDLQDRHSPRVINDIDLAALKGFYQASTDITAAGGVAYLKVPIN